MCVCVCVCVYKNRRIYYIISYIIFFFLLALQHPLGVVFYSPLAGFSLLACEVS